MNDRRKVQHVSVLMDSEDLARIYWVMSTYRVNKTTATQMLVKQTVTPPQDELAPIINRINAGEDIFNN